MLFYRSPQHSAEKQSGFSSVRVQTTVALAAYPIGATIIAMSARFSGIDILALVGYGFVALAFFAALPVLGSSLQRITAESITELDEMEMQMRFRATSIAYWIFCSGLLLAVMYFAIASDADWWLPSGYDGFNGLFWGIFLYAILLPTAVLSWTMRSPQNDD